MRWVDAHEEAPEFMAVRPDIERAEIHHLVMRRIEPGGLDIDDRDDGRTG